MQYFYKTFLIIFSFLLCCSCLKEKSIENLQIPLSVLANKNFYFILNRGNKNSFVSIVSRYQRKIKREITLPFDNAQCFALNENHLFVASENVLFSYDISRNKKLKNITFPHFVFSSIFASKKALYAFVYDLKEQKNKFILIHRKNFLFKDLTPDSLTDIDALTYDKDFDVVYFVSDNFQVNRQTKLFRYQKSTKVFMPIVLKKKANFYYVSAPDISHLFLSGKSLFYYINKKKFLVEIDINFFRFKREFFLDNEGKDFGQFFFDKEAKEFLIPDKKNNRVTFYSY